MLENFFTGLNWMDVINGLFLKILTVLLFFPLTLIFKPVRTRGLKWLKKVAGKTKHSVIVTGRIYSQHSRMSKNEGFLFEVELPYKDISENSMSISESDALIYNEVNHKYQQDFYANGYHMNHIAVKKIES